jgi:HK97 gp10 family phage protein
MAARKAFTIEGLRGLASAVEELGREASTTIPKSVLEYVATVAEQQAQIDCPVLSGYLRSTIRKEILSDLEAAVYATADYAAHVEYGTSKMEAQPFLEPAFRNSERVIKQLYLQRVQASWAVAVRKYSFKG